jgi:uncharacterized membrane protein YoaK (UPF0700 family)
MARREAIVTSEHPQSNVWLSLGLAFIGGYADAAGFLLANTFTGHITGNLVLSAISVARADWPTFSRRVLAIALFLAGILCSVILERFVARRRAWSLLPAMMGIEIALILLAYCALTSHLAAQLEVFITCMSLALGLQNGGFHKAGGLSVHTTYLTGMITDLVRTEAEQYTSGAALSRASAPDPKRSILCGIWLAFVLGAAIGAAMVFRLEALAIVGAALLLFATLIREAVTLPRY